MKLQRVEIERFRSAGSVSLEDTDNFNVLIGKNNSGKSTILLGIDAFFNCLRAESLVSLEPPFGRSVDFTGQNLSEPLTFTLTFALTESERANLLAEIVKEAQQLRNVIEGIESSLLISVSVAIAPQPNSYSYVSGIRVFGATTPTGHARVLLTLTAKTADELAIRQKRIGNSNQRVTDLSRLMDSFDVEDFNRVKKDEGETRAYLRYRLSSRRIIDGSPESLQLIEQLIRGSDTFPAFRASAIAYRNELVAEMKANAAEPLSNLLQTFSGEQASVPRYALDLLKRIAATKVLFLTERREPVGRAEARQLLDYKVSRGGPERLLAIQRKIETLLGVKVDAFESSHSGPGERNAEMDVDEFLLEVNGSGVKEALRLILDVELKKPMILLVEEPEVHLHPALEINMMQYLKEISKDCQVFLTTHSTNFLDLASAQGVYFITKSDKQTNVKRLTREEVESEIPRDLGMRLSSLFMFDRLVFVEGLSDELILREFAASLGLNLSEANVGFVHLQGARNFAHFANEATFSLLSKRRVRCTFIIDRDERDDAEVTQMRNTLGDRAKLHVLKRRELENYLIEAKAIAEFIRMKLTMGGTQSSAEIGVEAVQQMILNVAEELRSIVTLKRASRNILGTIHQSLDWQQSDKFDDFGAKVQSEIERLRGELAKQEARIATVAAETKRLVDGTFQNGWISLVPGDLLIDEVCKRFGARYKKVNDGPRLAALFGKVTIDPELSELIKAIAS